MGQIQTQMLYNAKKTLNSIILGQSIISKKRNSSKSGERTLSMTLNKSQTYQTAKNKNTASNAVPTVPIKVI